MDVFETLAEPTRRRIVELLSEGERRVNELCGQFEISQPAVSRHLRVLREAQLVSSRVDAQRRLYSLTPEPLEEMDRWLERYRSFWSERLDRLEDLLLEEQRKKKQDEERKKP
jgi:DNA-binding transcriptional ArsR family regulator